jgi:hypothetical protein
MIYTVSWFLIAFLVSLIFNYVVRNGTHLPFFASFALFTLIWIGVQIAGKDDKVDDYWFD